MSPEQARGKPVDRRADIWAFGVMLYEMLSGHRLFAGETVSDTLAGVLKTEIDLDAAARRRLPVRPAASAGTMPRPRTIDPTARHRRSPHPARQAPRGGAPTAKGPLAAGNGNLAIASARGGHLVSGPS